ncbi:unnamed protein product [Alternaria alternata]
MFKHYRTPSPADECPDIFFDREFKRPRRTDPTPVARTQRNLSVGDLRQFLTIWDFTMNPSQQPEAAVDRAATIIFSGILMFPDEEQRRETIWDQVHQRLVQLLFIHGFTSFTFKMEKSVPQLLTSSTTVTPIPLPAWLNISYIIIVDPSVNDFLDYLNLAVIGSNMNDKEWQDRRSAMETGSLHPEWKACEREIVPRRLLEILPAGNESAAARQRRETSARAHIAKAERTMAELQAWVSEAVESERNVLAQINNNPEVHVASRKEAEFRLRWAME